MAVKKGGLNKGKGLETLIPKKIQADPFNQNVKTEVQVVEKIVEKVVEKPADLTVRISQVVPNAEQPRKEFDEEALRELAESIRQYGVLQPLLVQKKGKYYEIIAGERRWRAAKMAGLKKIPVLIKEFSPQETMEISLIENIQRENLNAIEEAMAYKRLLTEFNLKQDDVAKRVSKSRTAITNSMRLLKLDERVQNMLAEEQISAGHARALLGIEHLEQQFEVAEKIVREKLSVRETEKLIKQIQNPRMPKEKPEATQEDVLYHQIEETLKEILGSKVSIRRKSKEKGIVEIEYYSAEDLERIMDLMRHR